MVELFSATDAVQTNCTTGTAMAHRLDAARGGCRGNQGQGLVGQGDGRTEGHGDGGREF